MKVLTIGRDKSNDIVLRDDPLASRHHLQIIEHDDGHFTLNDFGSTNGTYVNGNRVRGEVTLNEMDIVRIGNTTIPWRDYFYLDDNTDSSHNSTLSYDNDISSISSSEITEKPEKTFSNKSSKFFFIVALLSGIITITKECVLIYGLYLSDTLFWILESFTFITAIALIVISAVLILNNSKE